VQAVSTDVIFAAAGPAIEMAKARAVRMATAVLFTPTYFLRETLAADCAAAST
jgi:hypothetical protein